MNPLRWELWEGTNFPATKYNAVIYFFPAKVDIENHGHINDLIDTIHEDGITPSKQAARALLEEAIVVHGSVFEDLGEREFYTGDSFLDRHISDATWVELDEYSD